MTYSRKVSQEVTRPFLKTKLRNILDKILSPFLVNGDYFLHKFSIIAGDGRK